MNKRTKIVGTLGPASESADIITKMVKAGMNVARLNFAHGTYEHHEMLIKHTRRVAEETGEPLAILQDLRGPKIRVGELPEEGVELKEGGRVVFDTSVTEYRDGVIPIDFRPLYKYVQRDERMLLNDGRSEVVLTSVHGTRLEGEVKVGGNLTSHQGINVPDSNLLVAALTDKDKKDAWFGVQHSVDLIALSFVMSAKDVLDLRYLIKQYEGELGLEPEQPIRIIAKIERGLAVKNIREILDAADGIMVARGDLGVEIPAQDVPLVQKRLIDACLDAAKPVIVATQMLDSMREQPRPTRAEVSDVANAVIDHTDAVMLSNETAIGKYPVETIKTMSDIILEAERSIYDNLPMRAEVKKTHHIDDIISGLSRLLAERIEAKLILAASISGETGRLISRYRPELPIVVGTSTERVRCQLNLSWSVRPFLLEPCASIEELVERSVLYLKRTHAVKPADKIIVVAGEPVGHAGHVNLLEVREVR